MSYDEKELPVIKLRNELEDLKARPYIHHSKHWAARSQRQRAKAKKRKS